MKHTLTILLAVLGLSVQAQEPTADFQHDIQSEKKPWTHLNFKNNPDNFQFAIVTDNTGGMRRPVFETAVTKLNLMQPEFVMSVGDLIEGYTMDQEQIDKEWLEFNGWAGNIEMPFFYVPGNHDISNAKMQKDWEERYGVRYYSFLYKNVLFICIDTDDMTVPAWFKISKEQETYIHSVLDANKDVRYTFFFMHHPMWSKESSAFARIEEKLKSEGRKYTMFAGHNHRYMHDIRQGKNYYTLATTGGGSPLLGPEFGTFDHITWVTVTDEEPIMANLWLDGILEMDLVNPKNKEVIDAITEVAKLEYKVKKVKDGSAEVVFSLENKSSHPVKLNGQFIHHHQLQITQPIEEVVLNAGSKEEFSVRLSLSEGTKLEEVDPLDMIWTISSLEEEFKHLQLNGTKQIELAEKPKAK
ncbi:MAG: hypothetical protein RL266_480 [Bacteroidota bacterium]